MEGRRGPRTKEQRTRALLRRSKSATQKYSIGGTEKKGHNKPRPITLPTVRFSER